MSAAHAFETKERREILFPHAYKAVMANEKFYREFYGENYINSTYFSSVLMRRVRRV
jgi:hypothetical protein